MNSAPSSSQYHERDSVPEWLTPSPFNVQNSPTPRPSHMQNGVTRYSIMLLIWSGATFAWRQIGVLKQKVNFCVGSWLISFILVAALYQLLFSLSFFSWDDWSNVIYKSLVSLFFCLTIVLIASAFDRSNQLFKY